MKRGRARWSEQEETGIASKSETATSGREGEGGRDSLKEKEVEDGIERQSLLESNSSSSAVKVGWMERQRNGFEVGPSCGRVWETGAVERERKREREGGRERD